MVTRKDLNFKEFEELLNKEKTRVLESLDALQDEVNTIALEDEIDDIEDMAQLQAENSVDQTVMDQLEIELEEIDAALERIKTGKYGICEMSSKPIPIERLMANPTARTII